MNRFTPRWPPLRGPSSSALIAAALCLAIAVLSYLALVAHEAASAAR